MHSERYREEFQAHTNWLQDNLQSRAVAKCDLQMNDLKRHCEAFEREERIQVQRVSVIEEVVVVKKEEGVVAVVEESKEKKRMKKGWWLGWLYQKEKLKKQKEDDDPNQEEEE